MKAAVMQKNNGFAELWDFTTVLDTVNGRVDTYYKVKDISFIVTPAAPGVLSLFSPEHLRYNAQLRNLRDKDGNYFFVDAVTGEPALAYVGVSEAVLTYNGTIVGYRHDVARGME